jgi:hypothetical protein
LAHVSYRYINNYYKLYVSEEWAVYFLKTLFAFYFHPPVA